MNINEEIIENYKVAPYTEQETIITYDAEQRKAAAERMKKAREAKML